LVYGGDENIFFSGGPGDSWPVIWDVKRRWHRLLRGHTAFARDLAFSPDGLLLASADDDGNIIVWSVQVSCVLFLVRLGCDR